MKSKTILSFPLLLVTISLLVVVRALDAQNTSTDLSPREFRELPGSASKTEDVIWKSDAIFVGQIMTLGTTKNNPEEEGASFGSDYHGVQVTVSQVLRGSLPPETSVTLFVGTAMRKHIFTVGSMCLFFVKGNAQGAIDPYIVLKLLPASADNLAKVKALIAAAPAGK